MKMEVIMRSESQPTRPMRSVLMELFICGRLKTTMDTTLPKSPRTPTLLMRIPWTTNSKVTSNDQLSTSLVSVGSCNVVNVKFSIVAAAEAALFAHEHTIIEQLKEKQNKRDVLDWICKHDCYKKNWERKDRNTKLSWKEAKKVARFKSDIREERESVNREMR